MTTTIPWNTLAGEFVANSARWFPNLHETPFAAVVHFTLGLAGEVGELLEACGTADETVIGFELADVVTYTLDIAAALDIDVEVEASHTLPAARTATDALVMLAGNIANVVKKANRVDDPMALLADHHEDLRTWAAAIIYIAGSVATLYRIDLLASIYAKVAICEERWG